MDKELKLYLENLSEDSVKLYRAECPEILRVIPRLDELETIGQFRHQEKGQGELRARGTEHQKRRSARRNKPRTRGCADGRAGRLRKNESVPWLGILNPLLKIPGTEIPSPETDPDFNV